MQVFLIIKTELSKLGFGQNQRPFNKPQLMYTLKAVTFIISLWVNLFAGPKTSKDYMNAILITTEGTLIFAAFFCSIPQKANIFRLIDMVEKMTEERK